MNEDDMLDEIGEAFHNINTHKPYHEDVYIPVKNGEPVVTYLGNGHVVMAPMMSVQDEVMYGSGSMYLESSYSNPSYSVCIDGRNLDNCNYPENEEEPLGNLNEKYDKLFYDSLSEDDDLWKKKKKKKKSFLQKLKGLFHKE